MNNEQSCADMVRHQADNLSSHDTTMRNQVACVLCCVADELERLAVQEQDHRNRIAELEADLLALAPAEPDPEPAPEPDPAP